MQYSSILLAMQHCFIIIILSLSKYNVLTIFTVLQYNKLVIARINSCNIIFCLEQYSPISYCLLLSIFRFQFYILVLFKHIELYRYVNLLWIMWRCWLFYERWWHLLVNILLFWSILSFLLFKYSSSVFSTTKRMQSIECTAL
jgi:hypothetical protein